MKIEEQSAFVEMFAKYLEECGLSGKTLIHYPQAVDVYMPTYIRKHIDPNFECFYNLKVEDIKDIFNRLENSDFWVNEIARKTWKLRLKAIEYFITFIEKMIIKMGAYIFSGS